VSDLDRLRQLLLAEELDAIADAKQRLQGLEREQQDFSQRLPQLIEQAPANEMTKALSVPVAHALGSAVRDNSGSIVDALFPVIGPIIRKAISEALRGLMSDLNSVLERSFTLHGLKWRLEAWRSGVPYAQVVLKHSLRYRIDHVFLIERDSGLVLHRESSPGLPDLDADAIAGMLTAIGQFVRDSVGQDGGDTLEAARVGEYLLWVIEGPRASLACFIHGVPPPALREVLNARLEQIHARLGDPSGDLSALAAADAVALNQDLDPVGLVRDGAGEEVQAKPSRWPLMLIILLVLTSMLWYYARIERWQAELDQLRGSLEAHPGFLLTGMKSHAWRSLDVEGLLDPDASPIEPHLQRSGFDDVRTTLHVDGYLSSDDEIVARRARRLLQPPSDIRISVEKGVLSVRGAAQQSWIDTANDKAAWVAGVRTVDLDVTEISDHVAAARAELETLGSELNTTFVFFVRDTVPVDGAEQQLESIVRRLKRAQELSQIAQTQVRFEVEGFNDAIGSDEINAGLRVSRAVYLTDALIAGGVDPEQLLQANSADPAAGSSILVRGAKVRLVHRVETE
jgi:outer membrane protein OmpA-like peptidoglycan-associated protein